LKPQNIYISEDLKPIIVGFDRVVEMNSEELVYGEEALLPPEMRKLYRSKTKIKFTGTIDIFDFGLLVYYIERGVPAFDTASQNYKEWLKTPIEFKSGDSLDLYKIIRKTLTVQENRIDSDELVALISGIIDSHEDHFFTRNYKYFLDEEKEYDLNEILDNLKLKIEKQESSNKINVNSPVKKKINNMTLGQNSVILKEENEMSQEKESIISLKIFLIFLFVGLCLITGIILLICMKWTTKSKISKKFVKKQIKEKKKNRKKKIEKDLIQLDQSLVKTHV
jgi:hypothetical protein